MLQPEDYADVPINTEDHANVLLRFDNGNKGVITVSQVSGRDVKTGCRWKFPALKRLSAGVRNLPTKCGSVTATKRMKS